MGAGASPAANTVFGAVVDELLNDSLSVTMTAVGFAVASEKEVPTCLS